MIVNVDVRDFLNISNNDEKTAKISKLSRGLPRVCSGDSNGGSILSTVKLRDHL